MAQYKKLYHAKTIFFMVVLARYKKLYYAKTILFKAVLARYKTKKFYLLLKITTAKGGKSTMIEYS